MKLWVPMLILSLAVISLCAWDTVYSQNVISTMETKSSFIYSTLQTTEINDEILQQEIYNLNEFWTKKMDTLSISISRKDMQPISDYLQYLCSSIKNNNQEDAITYSRLLNYNVIGLKETLGLSWINLL